MKINANIPIDVSAKDLAKILANVSPEDFHSFWLAFNEIVNQDKIRDFGIALGARMGSNANKPIKTLYEYIIFTERAENMGLGQVIRDEH